MVSTIPKGVCTKEGRMSVVLKNAPRYRRARKKLKSAMLDELCAVLHYNRKYLALLLRSSGRSVFTHRAIRFIADPRISLTAHRGRKKVYPPELVQPLQTIWQLAGCIASRHLAVFIRAHHHFLFQDKRLKHVSAPLRRKLIRVSPATIDRLLGPTRKKLALKLSYQRKPGASWLKKTIPIQAYQNKPAKPFGYLEIDLVHHGGDVPAGQFAYTLTVTEITTGWTELRVLPNKASVFVVRAMKSILRSLPFRVSHIHSDNGSEFINRPLAQLARALGIPFTRSRAFRKNDAPYVESKNWSLVRVYVGYRRYDTGREIAALRRLARLVTLKHNLFIPTMKLERRQRDGARIHKRHSVDIPVRRLLAGDQLTKRQQCSLRQLSKSVNYFDLSARLEREQSRLDQAYSSKYAPSKSTES